ncbi:MAG: TatD family hydrolase [Proteobacteria bacterium]|nr:TatD family hydrolase [Pseudomonadota bacterium]
MKWIDPHIHMVSRTTDDYERMAVAGCAAVTEPAFWAGFDRAHASHFRDYFLQIAECEQKRAALFGIRHFCWLCLNPKEAEDPELGRQVVELIPELLSLPSVLGIGEIGLNKNSKNEVRVLERHIALAADHDQLILVHTPHLEDKLKGTRLIMDALKNEPRIRPGRVIIDHAEEHTVGLILDQGFWAGLTLYPNSKCTPQRAVDIFEMYGPERIWINSAADWGNSDPLAVPRTLGEMKRRGHPEAVIQKLGFENPAAFLGQSGKFTI